MAKVKSLFDFIYDELGFSPGGFTNSETLEDGTIHVTMKIPSSIITEIEFGRLIHANPFPNVEFVQDDTPTLYEHHKSLGATFEPYALDQWNQRLRATVNGETIDIPWPWVRDFSSLTPKFIKLQVL